MRFEKGTPKPANSGRKKGSLNKKKIPKVADYLAEKGVNPAEEILDILEADQALPEKDRKISKYGAIGIWMDLMSYCQGKPKEYEDKPETPGDEDLEDLNEEQLLKIVRSETT